MKSQFTVEQTFSPFHFFTLLPVSSSSLERIFFLRELFDFAIHFSAFVKKRQKLQIRREKRGAQFDRTRTGAVDNANVCAAHFFNPAANSSALPIVAESSKGECAAAIK
jgi:hypothetical protein